MFKIKLGQKVKDTITGFEGVITSRLEHQNGCIQYCVTPTYLEKGEMVEGQYLDEDRLEVIDISATNNVKKTESIGGDMRDRPNPKYPG